MCLPGPSTWTPGVCTGQCGPQSYSIIVGDREFRCNRRQLIHAQEPRPQDPPNIEPDFGDSSGEQVHLQSRCQTPRDPHNRTAHRLQQPQHRQNKNPVPHRPHVGLGGLASHRTGSLTMSHLLTGIRTLVATILTYLHIANIKCIIHTSTLR